MAEFLHEPINTFGQAVPHQFTPHPFHNNNARTPTSAPKHVEKGTMPPKENSLRQSFEKGQSGSSSNDYKDSALRRASDDALDFLLRSDWLDDDYDTSSSFTCTPDLMFGTATTNDGHPSPLMSPNNMDQGGDYYMTGGGQDEIDMIGKLPRTSFLSDVDRSSDLSMISLEDIVDLGVDEPQPPPTSKKTQPPKPSKKQTKKARAAQTGRLNAGASNQEDQDPLLVPSQTININELLPTVEPLALACPLISATGQVILGTWNQEHEMIDGGGSQTIVCGQLQKAWTSADGGVLKDVTDGRQFEGNKFAMHITGQQSVPGNVVTMKWFHDGAVAVAAGKHVSLVNVHGGGHQPDVYFGGISSSSSSSSNSDVHRVELPHDNTIRDIDVHRGRILSGGFDGKIVVCEVTASGESRVSCEMQTEEVVGSVKWHPSNDSVFSCTQDLGTVLLYDLRATGGKEVHKYESKMSNGFTHSYDGENTIVMGFAGDEQRDYHMEFVDLRMGLIGKKKKKNSKKKHVMGMRHNMRDPHMEAIGDILIVPGSQLGRRYLMFGQPGFSVMDGQDIQRGQLLASAGHYITEFNELSTTGCMIPDTNSQSLFTTDSLGNINLFNLKPHLSFLQQESKTRATTSSSF